jgi:CRISPR-associated protein Cas5d
MACFTRPEMKVERVSYPVPTASAARGVLEAIFWKPQFAWQVQEVWVLKPIRYVSLLRNEVKSKASVRSTKRWAKSGGYFDIGEERTQRHTLALRDVAYVIRAQVRVKPHCDAHPAKFRDQFRRRIDRGQCFTRPYLGCREFAAYFARPKGDEEPLDLDRELGRMLLDMTYPSEENGRGEPRFFEARLDHGIVRFPALVGEEV